MLQLPIAKLFTLTSNEMIFQLFLIVLGEHIRLPSDRHDPRPVGKLLLIIAILGWVCIVK
jgi:hypothetical protein